MVPVSLPQSGGSASNHPNNSNSNSNSNSNEYEEALDRLQPLQPILRGFNHRNRNQHRRAMWWAPFGMLRRHVDKVVDELLEYIAVASKSKSSSAGKKRKLGDSDDRSSGRSGKKKKEDERAEEKVRGRAGWLRDVLVPRCYLAFSQLAADNQFATLGVVLLGALAQVNTACARVVGEAESSPAETRVAIAASSAAASGPATGAIALAETSSSLGAIEPPGRQGGAVISRDAVARAETLRKKRAGSDTALDKAKKGKNHSQDHDDDDDKTSIGKQRNVAPKTKTKTKTKETDATPSSEEKVNPPKKKKKTKKSGGDEFDALFKGLF